MSEVKSSWVAIREASAVRTSSDWRTAKCPEVNAMTTAPEASRVRSSRIVIPPPTMSNSPAAGRSQMSGQTPIPRRENARSAPSRASRAVTRAAS